MRDQLPSADQPLRGDLARTLTPISGTLKRCKLFPSQQYAASKRRRLKRIGARTVPELTEVFAAGKVTLRQYDLISRLAPKQQRERVSTLNWEIEGAQIAAK